MRWNNTVLSVSDIYYLTQIVYSTNGVRIIDLPKMWGSIPIPSTRILNNTIELLIILNYVTSDEERVYIKEDVSLEEGISEFKTNVCNKLWALVDEVGLSNVLTDDAITILEDSLIEVNTSSIKIEYKTIINLIFQCSDAKYEDGFAIFKVVSENLNYINLQRKAYTSKMQRQEMEEKVKIGKIAEDFVYVLETDLLNQMTVDESPIKYTENDVGIGYDILSYDYSDGTPTPKYIEVKGITKRNRFFISQNEINIAKKYADSYWLYLVYLNNKYEVISVDKINNPYVYLFSKESDWEMEYESYKFTKKK